MGGIRGNFHIAYPFTRDFNSLIVIHVWADYPVFFWRKNRVRKIRIRWHVGAVAWKPITNHPPCNFELKYESTVDNRLYSRINRERVKTNIIVKLTIFFMMLCKTCCVFVDVCRRKWCRWKRTTNDCNISYVRKDWRLSWLHHHLVKQINPSDWASRILQVWVWHMCISRASVIILEDSSLPIEECFFSVLLILSSYETRGWFLTSNSDLYKLWPQEHSPLLDASFT